MQDRIKRYRKKWVSLGKNQILWPLCRNMGQDTRYWGSDYCCCPGDVGRVSFSSTGLDGKYMRSGEVVPDTNKSTLVVLARNIRETLAPSIPMKMQCFVMLLVGEE